VFHIRKLFSGGATVGRSPKSVDFRNIALLFRRLQRAAQPYPPGSWYDDVAICHVRSGRRMPSTITPQRLLVYYITFALIASGVSLILYWLPLFLENQGEYILQFFADMAARRNVSGLSNSPPDWTVLSVPVGFVLLLLCAIFAAFVTGLYRAGGIPTTRGRVIIGVCGVGYFILIVHAFALLYLLLLLRDPHAILFPCNSPCPGMDAVSAWYFSLSTIATVGFGDIHPVSRVAKVVVIGEILIGLAYTVFIFSVLAIIIRGEGRR
jgi:hypothetical protein